MITRIIGIDFGTSTTVVRINNHGKEHEQIQTLSVSNNVSLIPTIVFKRKSDDMLFFAEEATVQIGQGTEGELKENFKIGLIDNDQKVREEAEELTSNFFNYLYKRYEEKEQAGFWGKCDRTKVYVSYPAKWPSFIRLTMINCAIKAGFGTNENVFGLDEPTAAVLACMHENTDKLKNLELYYEHVPYKSLMIDMGAGTTDLVLFTYIIDQGQIHLQNLVTYPTVDSDKLCGGREIDQILGLYCQDYAKRIPASGNPPEGPMKKCMTEAKNWKEYVVSPGLLNNETIHMPIYMTNFIDMMKSFGIPMNNITPFSINRLTFEAITQQHWTEWRELLLGALEEGKKFGYESADEIDIIILTGGHSQWYGTQDFLLNKHFANLESIQIKKIQEQPNRLIHSTMPQYTVATGLCLKDEAIVAAMPMSYSLWIQFEYEGKKSRIIEVLRKGERLPFDKTLDTIKESITGNFIYRKEFSISCYVYEGNTLATAKKQKVSTFSPDDGFIKIIFKTAILAIASPFVIAKIIYDWWKGQLDWSQYKDILDNEYTIELIPHIIITENGIATVKTSIKVDDNDVSMPDIQI